MFFFRLLPWLSASLIAVTFYFQFRQPFQYPWIALIGLAGLLLAAFLVARGHVTWFDLIEKFLPTVVFIVALIFAMLLSEGRVQQIVIIIFGSLAAYLSMELLFFLAFMPWRYPVHGLSRVNIAYVPFILFYAIATSAGLMTFLHSPKWIHVAGLVMLSLLLFRTTGHPDATPEQNRIWMLIGMMTGLHIGLLGTMLPLSMYTQGAIGMLAFSVILRLRRYLYHPTPHKVQAWIEAVAVVILFATVLTTARWL